MAFQLRLGISFRTIRALMVWGDACRRRTVMPEQFKTGKQKTLDRLLQWIDEDEKRLVLIYPEREEEPDLGEI